MVARGLAMDAMVDGVRAQIASINAHLQAAHQEIAALLATARQSDLAGREMTEAVLEAVEVVGRSEQAHAGELILLLAEAERHTPRRRGLVPWLSTHLDLSEGAARGLA